MKEILVENINLGFHVELWGEGANETHHPDSSTMCINQITQLIHVTSLRKALSDVCLIYVSVAVINAVHQVFMHRGVEKHRLLSNKANPQPSWKLWNLEISVQCPTKITSSTRTFLDPSFGCFFFSDQVWDMMLNTWSCWTLNCVRCIVYGMNL